LPGHFIPDDVFLSAEDVVALLQVNLRTIYRMIKARQIPAVRVGRQWRFRQRDIESWLEAQRTMPASRRVPTATSSSPPSQRVLVVDDESSIREMLSKTLALAEYKVDTAPDATAALNLLRMANTSYDLLIADLRMPGMNGLSMIRQVKQIRSGMPIIIITGFSSESSAIEAVNLGVKGYLIKPFRVTQVLAAAANAMGVSAA
jgi:excisionase family DNA binding protein